MCDLKVILCEFSSSASSRDSFEEMKVEITAIKERLDASTSTGRENSDQGTFEVLRLGNVLKRDFN